MVILPRDAMIARYAVVMCLPVRVSVKLKFHGTDTDTDTDILADFSARILARKSARAGQSACCGARGPFSSPTCPRTFVRRALFLARMSVGHARVYTCTCTVHDKLSRLQNYTIGASLKSVSVSVPWNPAIIRHAAKVYCVEKPAFHDADADILAKILADSSDTRDFLKSFLQQAERHADIYATILARISVSLSVSASWNAG